MQTYMHIAQIMVSVLLAATILFQVRGEGSGMFGSAQGGFRVRTGIELLLFRFTIVLAVLFVLISIVSVRLVVGDDPEAPAAGEPLVDSYAAPLSPTVHGYRLAEPTYWRHPVSHTFHGRDVFGPVAAHLALGLSPDALGPPVDDVRRLVFPTVERHDGVIHGQVVHVDRFGNLVTNIPGEAVGTDALVEVGGTTIEGLAVAYDTGAALVALVGSHGFLEVAAPMGSASRVSGVGRRAPVRVGRGK